MSGEICTDNRFEIIAAYKKKLIERTNIESRPEEMAVIDSILFRFWQMGWLPPIPHGDLIDRDALIKNGWLNLHKEVMRMGGYAVHELPLKNPSIPVIIPAESVEEDE